MAPLFFRGAILISEKILSYNDFMTMTYSQFKRIEATYSFLTNMKNSTVKNEDNVDMKDKLSKLQTISLDELDLPEEYKEIF
jgi:hypothetical protein